MERLCKQHHWRKPSESICSESCELWNTDKCLLSEKNKNIKKKLCAHPNRIDCVTKSSLDLANEQAKKMYDRFDILRKQPGLSKAFQQMIRFHQKNKQCIGTVPNIPHAKVFLLRERLIEEEWIELHDAMMIDDLAQIADGCVDLIYVIIGTAVSYGIYLPDIWEAVHNKNMSKSGGQDAGGKVMKQETFEHVDIKNILEKQDTLCYELKEK